MFSSERSAKIRPGMPSYGPEALLRNIKYKSRPDPSWGSGGRNKAGVWRAAAPKRGVEPPQSKAGGMAGGSPPRGSRNKLKVPSPRAATMLFPGYLKAVWPDFCSGT